MRFIYVFVLFLSFQSVADSTNFNREIIERPARTETKADEGFKYIQMQLDNQKKDIDSKFYMNMAVLLALFGFIYWDRRTTLAPIEKENQILKQKVEKLEKAIEFLSTTNPKFAEFYQSLRLG